MLPANNVALRPNTLSSSENNTDINPNGYSRENPPQSAPHSPESLALQSTNVCDALPETIVISPHGGKLINRILQGNDREVVLERAKSLIQVPLTAENIADLEMIATGAYSPLTGFMGQADYARVVKEMRLVNELVWPIPIVLPISEMLAGIIQEGTEVALVWKNEIIGVMGVIEKYQHDKELEVSHVYGSDIKGLSCHPGIERVLSRDDTLLAGPIRVIDLPKSGECPHLHLTPFQTRQMFAARGWQTIVGFQTRNPPHRVHEFIQKHALQMVDGLFVHPATHTLPDDITLPNLVESYQILLENYYPQECVLLSIFPAPMRFAGPREAIFHAICRKNYGCTHFIVGRDHAGYGGYYHPEAACNIFKQFRSDEIGIEILSYRPFYCKKCDTVVTPKICPHEGDDISGTEIRIMLRQGQFPSSKVMRPEVSEYLIKALSSKS